ncbi:MAG: glycosyltransferase family 39 protein [Chlorobia bacterium]|nr:glycosyltransferase family 39 protein [Fimbriimonadaceae bacterium]
MPKRQLTNLALCLAVVPLFGWWLTGLFDLDEGFYAAVVGEMNRRGEWVTPYFNGQPWFEKPILLYWLAKPMVAIFGDTIGPRLPSVLSTIGCYLLIAWYARRRLSEDAAAWSVAILGSSLVFVAVGRLMMTDMPLVLAFSAAMLMFWESLVGDRRWRLLSAGLLGVAVLAKGPVALILFALIAGWTYWRERELRPAFRGHWLFGTFILAAVICLWYVPAYLANGDLFVQKFLIEQNIGRFTGGDKAHTIKAVWAYILYIPVIFIGMMPWSYWMRMSWRESGEFAADESGTSKKVVEGNVQDQTQAFMRFLKAWALIIFLFFSISSAKLPHYVLPVFVPLAILLGVCFARCKPLENVRTLAFPIAWTLAVSILANAGFLWWYQQSGQSEAHAFARYIRANSLHKVQRTVAVFQIPKKEGRLSAGTLRLQETSLPSFLLYLDTTVNEADTVEEVIEKNSHWLFTRKGRITELTKGKFSSLDKRLNPIGPVGDNFELYEVGDISTPKPPPQFPDELSKN